jgi:hypothetical protein
MVTNIYYPKEIWKTKIFNSHIHITELGSLVVFKFFDLLFPCPYFCENIPPNKANSAPKVK